MLSKVKLMEEITFSVCWREDRRKNARIIYCETLVREEVVE